MSERLLVVCTLVVVLFAGGASGVASAQGQQAMPPMGAHRMEAMPMGEGMPGMMGDCGRMMHGDRMMHGGSMMDHMMVPQLPPGNEKLQLQMQAEMMQKMGEILAKYAARINEEKK
jgi:hypothetical protein